jgi:hypothetical protein
MLKYILYDCFYFVLTTSHPLFSFVHNKDGRGLQSILVLKDEQVHLRQIIITLNKEGGQAYLPLV